MVVDVFKGLSGGGKITRMSKMKRESLAHRTSFNIQNYDIYHTMTT